MILALNPPHALFRISLNVMLPESQDRPSIPSELSGYRNIPPHVSLNLIPPELLWELFLLVIPVAVPKIPVAEYYNLLSGKNEIGITKHLGIHLVLVSHIAKHLVHSEINLGVRSPDSGHDPGALLGSKYIRHYFSLTCRESLFVTSIFTHVDCPFKMGLTEKFKDQRCKN